MKTIWFNLLFILTSFASNAEGLATVYSDYFRGISGYGMLTEHMQVYDLGAELRSEKYIVIQSLHYRKDTVHSEYFGLGGSAQRYFSFPQVHLTPFLQFSNAVSYCPGGVQSETNVEPPTKIKFNLSLGAGTYIELSKYFQVGASLNYEMIMAFYQKTYFDVLPLIHLKYEFRFK